MASTEKYIILYGRLSQEDTQKINKTNDSNSIQNQRLLLEKYAAEKGFTNTMFLYDDGYSGTSFKRPSWQKVMELMENGQVETLRWSISRHGRSYRTSASTSGGLLSLQNRICSPDWSTVWIAAVRWRCTGRTT